MWHFVVIPLCAGEDKDSNSIAADHFILCCVHSIHTVIQDVACVVIMCAHCSCIFMQPTVHIHVLFLYSVFCTVCMA